MPGGAIVTVRRPPGDFPVGLMPTAPEMNGKRIDFDPIHNALEARDPLILNQTTAYTHMVALKRPPPSGDLRPRAIWLGDNPGVIE